MAITYKLKKSSMQDTATSVLREDDSDIKLSIPLNDPSNTDYQEYLKWVEAGNTPEAAD